MRAFPGGIRNALKTSIAALISRFGTTQTCHHVRVEVRFVGPGGPPARGPEPSHAIEDYGNFLYSRRTASSIRASISSFQFPRTAVIADAGDHRDPTEHIAFVCPLVELQLFWPFDEAALLARGALLAVLVFGHAEPPSLRIA
jgi:hypothetical protein